jgi:3-oxoacyl-[acyl-carrier protein] reductase
MVEGLPQRVQDQIRSEIPLGRFATIKEIASVVRFVASPEASYITGEILDVNGGIDL